MPGNRLSWMVLVLAMSLVFAACQGVVLPTSPVPGATETRGAEEGTPRSESPGITPPPGGAMAAQQVLAQQLHVPPDTVTVVGAERVEWPDACLGVSTPGVMCAQVITPGYRVILEAQGQRYEFHTDLDGGQVMLAAAPEPDRSGTVVTWTAQREGRCDTALIGPEQVLFGSCDGALISGRFALPERQAALPEFDATYAPFEAETPAGRVAFQGHGSREATPAEQRMIAEWASLVAVEAAMGRSGASYGLALAWHREGGIAGFCDDVTVYVTGEVWATTCKGNEPRTLGQGRLTAEELARLYTWMDNLQNWELNQTDPAKADAMTVTMVFSGRGTAEAGEKDRREILDFAAELFARFGG